jgi:hypothetical protein
MMDERIEKMERVGDIGKNGRILFDRPKSTAGCSANGRSRGRANNNSGKRTVQRQQHRLTGRTRG